MPRAWPGAIMRVDSLDLARRWELALGDPRGGDGRLSFSESLGEDEAEAFPESQLDTLRRMGLFEQLIPPACGGLCDEPERMLALARIVSRRNLSTAIAFGQCLLGSLPIWLAGSPAQRRAQAETLRAGGLACLALTERAHGSDILSTGFESQPEADGRHLRLSGEKWLINNGTRAASVTVLARQPRGDGQGELVLVRLPRPSAPCASWQPLPKVATHGIRGADISGFTLDAHRCLADEVLLPRSEPAMVTVLKTLQISRILCAGFALGATDTLLRLTLAFAGARALYGKTVLQIPAARARLAQAYARLLSQDLLAQVATRAIAVLPAELSVISPVCKYQLPVSCEAVARDLAVVLGARHYLRSQDELGMFQKMARDLQVVSLFDGSTQVNLALLASQLRPLQRSLSRAWDEPAADELQLIGRVRRLFDAQGAAEGWPEGSDLRLGGQGQDSVMQAYAACRRSASPVDVASVETALRALDARVRQCLAEVERRLWTERLPMDSCAAQELAGDYARLWAACVLALGWLFEHQAGQRASVRGAHDRSDLLLEGLRQTVPELGIAACEMRDQALLQAAVDTVEQRRQFSHTPLPSAW